MDMPQSVQATCPNISLRVGTKIVRANKEVLAKKSQYFNALFSYRAKFENNKDEIDLTGDVDSIADLKIIMKYIHSGFIDITKINVQNLVKMATFFGISELEKMCVLFIAEEISLRSCFNYYFFSRQYGLQDLEPIIKGYIETRFHDVLIYEETTTHLSCAELEFVLHNNFLQYCSKESIFDFLLNWMENKEELRKDHVDIITEVIDYFDHLKSYHNPPFEGRFSRNIIRLGEILGKHTDLSKTCVEELRNCLVEFQRKLPSRTKVKNAAKLLSQSSMNRQETTQNIGRSDILPESRTDGLKVTCPETLDDIKSEENKKVVTDEKEAENTGNSLAKGECDKKSREKAIKCDALFTLSERHVIETELDRDSCEDFKLFPDIDEKNFTFTQNPVYDLCVYDSVSRTWYHIATFDEDKYLDEVNKKAEKDLPDDMDSMQDEKLDTEISDVKCKIAFIGNEILFLDQSDNFLILKLNIATMEWRRIDLFDKIQDYLSLSNDKVDEIKLVMGKNGTVYIVVSYVVCDAGSDGFPGAERNCVRFEGFVVNPKSFSLKLIFKTKELLYTTYSSYDLASAQNFVEVEYSSWSNELLVVYSSGVDLHLAFVVNLNPLDNKLSDLLQPTLLLQDIRELKPVKCEQHPEILPLGDRFLVICNDNGVLTVSYEYIYHSVCLKKVENGPEYKIGERWKSFLESAQWYDTPHLDNCFWILEGKLDLICSYLKKVTFNPSEEPVVECHTPPPFDEPVAVFASKVHRKFFSKLKPVKHFLQTKKHVV